MNGRVAKEMRKQIRKGMAKFDYNDFMNGIVSLGFFTRLNFCFKVLIGK
jgi:hypothetical protein